MRRSVQQFKPRKLHKYESSDNFNSKATGSSVINPDWSFYEEASTLAKWSLVLSATSNVPSTGPNSLVRDNRRSAGQISEHVVCFDSTQTTPVDTTWVQAAGQWEPHIWSIRAVLCSATLQTHSIRISYGLRVIRRGTIETKLTKQSFSRSCTSDRSNYPDRSTMGHPRLLYWRL